MPLTRPLALALTLCAPAALALSPAIPEGRFLADSGVEYMAVEGAAGVILTSREPVTHHVGAAAEPRTGVETLHLNDDCTATSSLLGDGAWSWANGGFGAFFAGPALVAFPRQELPGAPEACRG